MNKSKCLRAACLVLFLGFSLYVGGQTPADLRPAVEGGNPHGLHDKARAFLVDRESQSTSNVKIVSIGQKTMNYRNFTAGHTWFMKVDLPEGMIDSFTFHILSQVVLDGEFRVYSNSNNALGTILSRKRFQSIPSGEQTIPNINIRIENSGIYWIGIETTTNFVPYAASGKGLPRMSTDFGYYDGNYAIYFILNTEAALSPSIPSGPTSQNIKNYTNFSAGKTWLVRTQLPKGTINSFTFHNLSAVTLSGEFQVCSDSNNAVGAVLHRKAFQGIPQGEQTIRNLEIQIESEGPYWVGVKTAASFVPYAASGSGLPRMLTDFGYYSGNYAIYFLIK